MRHVRPVRLVLTASLTAAALAVALYPRSAPEPAARMSVPVAPSVAPTADPADPVVPATADARVAIERAVLPAASGADQIPDVALAAYQRAASVASKVDDGCGITWTLLAAVGGVESDHGRHGGAVLGDDGVSTPLIRGVALDGRGRVARVADTDAGRVDGDRRWDRAVGPMQFLPATWATVGVDADGDGTRSADDIDDAALGAAVFLCAVPGDLTDRAGVRAALLRYNPSTAYVAEVIALERAYRTGDYAPPETGEVPATVVQAARQPQTVQSEQPEQPQQPDREPQAQAGVAGGEDGTVGSRAGGIKDWPDQQPAPEPEPTPETEAVTGVLTDCGTEAEPAQPSTWCLEETVLDLGDADYLAAPALGDFDGDAVVETNAEELAGLAGTEVTLTVLRREDAAPQVLRIGDLDYVATDPED
ncbi:hypothetical protein GCM10027062_41870 [Nocardioides hungaricus]